MRIGWTFDLLFRELKEMNHILEERVAEEAAIYREKDAMLIHRDRSAILGEMMGNIAHQRIQPLNSLALIVQEPAMRGASGELTREYLDDASIRVVEITRHLSRTINDFKDCSGRIRRK
jgi:signal transduction histidine kinase